MSCHFLRFQTEIHQPIDKVFAFFSEASNLNLLTPPELHFNIQTPMPVEMTKGTKISYQIRLHGIRFRWDTRITEWRPPYTFTDEQEHGPYRIWKHTHDFKPLNEHTTIMTDEVELLSPGGPFEPIIHFLFIKRKVRNIFTFREEQLKAIFH